MVEYDITRDGITGHLWLFLLWALFAAIFFTASLGDVRKPGGSVRSWFVLAISAVFVTVAVASLVSGIHRRQACLEAARSGDFDVTEGEVSQLRKIGRVAPFTYTFMVNERMFTIDAALVGSCGFSERPNFQLQLVDGARLVIEHRDDKIYRVISEH